MGPSKIQNTFFQCALILFALLPAGASSQSARELKKMFTQAETFFIFEDYEHANNLYLKLDSPDNFNIKYKIGACYLHIPGEKEKAIPFLESAVKNISFDSKTESISEKKSPIDAYFSLARAYMITNQPEKGMSTLEDLKKFTDDGKSKKIIKNISYIDQQLEACNNIITLKKNPVYFTTEALGDDFIHAGINMNAVVSFDGNTMVYTEHRDEGNALFMSKKVNGIWSKPVEITKQVRAGGDCTSCSLNYNGTELFLYKTGNFDGAIYSSVFVKREWTPMKKLNGNINSKYYESHASISSDGKRLYFTSNRKGGEGKLDIYVSKRSRNGQWGTATNLGPTINTPYNEETPFVTLNDSALYFASEGHSTMGGYDIFRSVNKGGKWSEPVNVGYPFNTADDDMFYQPAGNGNNGYYSVATDFRKNEIFHVIFRQPTDEKAIAATATGATNEATKDTLKKSGKEADRFITDVTSIDAGEKKDPNFSYYTVQLIALHRPVDVSYFKNINDTKVMYNDTDKYFRYTTGRFQTREEAEARKSELLKQGQSKQIFIREVLKH